MTDTPSAPLQRIAKVIAHSGVCSRRDAEKLILAGKVTVDSELVTTPAYLVGPAHKIRISGKPISRQQTIKLVKFYKPRNVLTTKRDPQGRKTIYDLLPPNLSGFIYVGRLDYASEGLILLTNNGDFSRLLEHPSTGLIRTYKARAHGVIKEGQINQLRQGITIEGVTYKPAQISVERKGTSNHWLTVTLTEGKNREVRKMLAHIGLTVNRLIRVQYGALILGNLKEGQVEVVPNPQSVLPKTK